MAYFVEWEAERLFCLDVDVDVTDLWRLAEDDPDFGRSGEADFALFCSDEHDDFFWSADENVALFSTRVGDEERWILAVTDDAFLSCGEKDDALDFVGDNDNDLFEETIDFSGELEVILSLIAGDRLSCFESAPWLIPLVVWFLSENFFLEVLFLMFGSSCWFPLTENFSFLSFSFCPIFFANFSFADLAFSLTSTLFSVSFLLVDFVFSFILSLFSLNFSLAFSWSWDFLSPNLVLISDLQCDLF